MTDTASSTACHNGDLQVLLLKASSSTNPTEVQFLRRAVGLCLFHLGKIIIHFFFQHTGVHNLDTSPHLPGTDTAFQKEKKNHMGDDIRETNITS